MTAETAGTVPGARDERGVTARPGGHRAANALKHVGRPGVRVFFYLEDRERTLDSPTDKIKLLDVRTECDRLAEASAAAGRSTHC